jgi:RNA polymerase sigma-70 factor (ECF subfamily)
MTEAETVFLRFVRLYWQRLHLVAQRFASTDVDAEDLVQEALLRAWKSFKPAEEHKYRGGWLFAILRSVAIDWARSRKGRIKLVPSDQHELTERFESEFSNPLTPLPPLTEDRFREFIDDKVASALDALEPMHREVVLLSVIGDLSYRDIADVLDCPVGTVMSRMARARRALRDRLADYARASGWKVENSR